MDKQTIREVNELMDVAHLLDPLERELLFNLDDKGPGLLLELAVRTLHFPEEVDEPLTDLRHRGLIQSDNFEGGQFGNELIYLSKRGDQIVALLREEALHPHIHSHHGLESLNAPAPSRSLSEATTSINPRQQEIELLNKLGDLAVQSGNAQEARERYQEALEITREIAGPTSRTRAATPPPEPCVDETAVLDASDLEILSEPLTSPVSSEGKGEDKREHNE